MKNQYFGDINDFRKYGLLRALSQKGKIRTVVCWMLTDMDRSNDGNKIAYLLDTRYRKYDPVLFDILKECLVDHKFRDICMCEQHDILPYSTFHNSLLTDNKETRTKYFDEVLQLAKETDLVFFDPDNGIEVKSVRLGNKNSSKYVYWDELYRTYKAGHSLLVYQHYPRQKREQFREHLAKQMQIRIGITDVITFSTSNVVFILAPHSRHTKYLHELIPQVADIWGDQFHTQMWHFS